MGMDEEIKEQAGQDVVLLLEKWRKRKKKVRIYRIGLCCAILISCLGLAGIGYQQLYQQIPSLIRLRAGMEQSLDLGLPMSADVVAVSEQGESNIPKDAITIDLARPVSIKTGSFDRYQMQVKLFGFLPIKKVGIQVIEDQELIPVGIPIGIYVKTEGILVIGVGEFTGQDGVTYSPSQYILKSGDYIRALNGEEVFDKDDFMDRIHSCNGSEIVLTIERDGQTIDLKVIPKKNENGEYKIGVWIRDNAQGVGTMTFIDEEGNFGALGHGINDVDTSTLMNTGDGTLYQTEIISIKKGESGEPGEMTGMIIYSTDRILGQITDNSVQGIFGTCNQKALNLIDKEPIPIALKQEIKLGPAQILCTVDKEAKYYDIEITAIHLNNDNVNRGIELKVTDPELLEITGGIVQGMSGAPIVQDGKFVGAVTHVLVNSPEKGYGIFIENMIEH